MSGGLSIQLRTHHLHADQSDTKSDTSSSLNSFLLNNIGDYQVGDRFLYKCSFKNCRQSFMRKDAFDRHEYSHTKQKKHNCPKDECDKAYITITHLKRHLRTFHEPKPPKCPDVKKKIKPPSKYSCLECSLVFRQKAQLRRHAYIHNGEYPHKCTDCGAGFSNYAHLRNHSSTHPKTRPCPKCNEMMSSWNALRTHLKTNHSSTETTCNVCNKVFSTTRRLREHCKIHTAPEKRLVFECTIENCPKYYFNASGLQTHIATKHKEKKFYCTLPNCLLGLSTKDALMKHQKMHERGGPRKPIAKKRPRNRRKDAGIPKKSNATVLANVDVGTDLEKILLTNGGENLEVMMTTIEEPHEDSDTEPLDIHKESSELMVLGRLI